MLKSQELKSGDTIKAEALQLDDTIIVHGQPFFLYRFEPVRNKNRHNVLNKVIGTFYNCDGYAVGVKQGDEFTLA